MLYVVLFLLGLAIGISIPIVILTKTSVGSLRVATDEDDAYLFLALSKKPDEWIHKKYVTLKVEVKDFKNDISQK